MSKKDNETNITMTENKYTSEIEIESMTFNISPKKDDISLKLIRKKIENYKYRFLFKRTQFLICLNFAWSLELLKIQGKTLRFCRHIPFWNLFFHMDNCMLYYQELERLNVLKFLLNMLF